MAEVLKSEEEEIAEILSANPRTRTNFLAKIPTEERIKGVPTEQRLEGLTPGRLEMLAKLAEAKRKQVREENPTPSNNS